VDVGAQQITMVVLDFQGQIRQERRREYQVAKTGSFLLEEIKAGIGELIRDMPRTLRRGLKGIGICVPGFLDRDRGVIRQSVNIRGFRDVQLLPHFASFDLPVLLDESSRCMALAEKWFGGHHEVEHLICIDAGYGIGMGIVHRGRLYRGANEVSGEIGHMVVDPKGGKCRCGNVGCLETVASGKALEREAKDLALHKMGIKTKGARAIFDAAVAGHPRARDILAQTGRYLGTAVANVINLFDPQVVVLNGGLVRADQFLMPELKKAVQRYTVKASAHNCQIQASTVGPLAGACGAAMLPLRSSFEFENIQL
jgi:predicted NBD/HSP70 family sugar kinase